MSHRGTARQSVWSEPRSRQRILSGGTGTEFHIHLAPAPGSPAAREDEARARRPQLPRARVLIVDDNEDAADLLSIALDQMGHESRVALDGATALDQARDFHPQLALLDIGLPVMDGYELARRLRADPATAKIALVALTGYGQASDRERTHAAGFDAHLVKPVKLTEVDSTITALLGAGSQRR